MSIKLLLSSPEKEFQPPSTVSYKSCPYVGCVSNFVPRYSNFFMLDKSGCSSAYTLLIIVLQIKHMKRRIDKTLLSFIFKVSMEDDPNSAQTGK